MHIIISPSKQMAVSDYDALPLTTPIFSQAQTARIYQELRKKTPLQLKKLWNCNDKILSENILRLGSLTQNASLSPAIFTYSGLQFKHIGAQVLSYDELHFLNKHLRIISAFYGILKPFDGISPYRLEMQAPLSIDTYSNLYDYWNSLLSHTLTKEPTWILNLASKEYSKSILPHLDTQTLCITCRFLIPKNDTWIEQSTQCKMARGQMISWLAKHNITEASRLKEFSRLNFHFSKEHSDETTYSFIKTL